MPILFGIILGALLTVAGAFAYDSASGRAPNGLPPSAAGGHPPLVNWDVVTEDWHGLELNLRGLGENIERGWKKIAG
jgi:hypothetical protein